MKFTSVLAAFLLISLQQVFAQQLRLPDYYSDNMVLQQNDTVHLWGWAGSTQPVEVTASWMNDTLKTTSAPDAKWAVNLATPKAGGTYTITVRSGGQEVTIHNILIGEVWLCSGQSNMQFSAEWHYNNWQQEVANANYPQIRLFEVYDVVSNYPEQELRGQWKICTPQTIPDFTAAGYFFGRSLYQHLHEPIGLIESCWGGTPVETWMPDSIFATHPVLAAAAATEKIVPWCPVKPAVTFNAMINPLLPVPIAGAIWYQGETNTAEPLTYESDFSKMIECWRNLWQKNFPFYFVQIASFHYGDTYSGALVREAQLQTYRNVPNTGMVVTSDISGDTSNIHPKDKQDVGARLADWALAKTYHIDSIAYSGPLYRSMQTEGNKIRIYFDFASDGLMAKGKEPDDFFIAGDDHQFVPATAKIEDSTIIVYNKDIKHPVAVRFGFWNTATPNLFNKSGLPASPFRTDDWEIPLKKQ